MDEEFTDADPTTSTNERVGSVVVMHTPTGIQKYRVVKKSAMQIIIEPGEKNEEIIYVKLIKPTT